MSVRRELLNGADPCQIARRWVLDASLAEKAVQLAAEFERITGAKLYIISGYRDPRHQLALRQAGRPAAPVELSNHTVCPARAVDVRPSIAASTNVKASLGAAAAFVSGLRWGGGSPLDRVGIPTDWNHFDLGPRQDQQADAYRRRTL